MSSQEARAAVVRAMYWLALLSSHLLLASCRGQGARGDGARRQGARWGGAEGAARRQGASSTGAVELSELSGFWQDFAPTPLLEDSYLPPFLQKPTRNRRLPKRLTRENTETVRRGLQHIMRKLGPRMSALEQFRRRWRRLEARLEDKRNHLILELPGLLDVLGLLEAPRRLEEVRRRWRRLEERLADKRNHLVLQLPRVDKPGYFGPRRPES